MNHLLENNNLNEDKRQKIMKHIDAIMKLVNLSNHTDQNMNREPANKKIQLQRRFFQLNGNDPLNKIQLRNQVPATKLHSKSQLIKMVIL